jgi:uncharacterized protein YqgQ
VLLLLPNQLNVTLSANSISMTNQSRGLRSRVLDQQHVSITQNDSELIWKQATDQLEKLLSAMQVNPRTRLSTVLSSDFVRYLILPAQKISMSIAEKSAYAIAAFRDVYGTAADGWHIKLQDSAPGQPAIAVAMDEKLLEKLKQISLEYQIKLVSVQPYLMHAFNRISNQLGKTNGYLVILESRRMLVIRLLRGELQDLHASVISNSDWMAELKKILARESLLGESTGKEVLLYTAGKENVAMNNIDGWNIRHIGETYKKKSGGNKATLVGAPI